MPEVVIKYKKPETLKMLKSMAKYFDFIVSPKKEKMVSVNGVTIIPADKKIDISSLEKIFSGKNIKPAELRASAWRRTK